LSIKEMMIQNMVASRFPFYLTNAIDGRDYF